MKITKEKIIEILNSNGKVDGLLSVDCNELLIKATYLNDYNLVCKLIELDVFDNKIIHDIDILIEPFPLYYITMCYKRVMWLDYREEIMPFIKKQRCEIDKLLKLWKEKFGVDVDNVIDYQKYKDYFFSAYDDDTDEDILDAPRDKFKDNGCRDIDMDLYVAVERFQFSKVKELLEMGANPDADLLSIDDKDKDYVEPCNCFGRIADECCYLATTLLRDFKISNEDWYMKYSVEDEDIMMLIGWAAHEDMYLLLEQK